MTDFHWSGRESRTRHLYIPGMTGTGKTSLMTNLVLSDLEYEHGPLIIIDPKGGDQGLVNRVLPHIPKGLVKDTFLLTQKNPVPLDLLGYTSDFDKAFVRSDMIDILQRFSYGSWGTTMQGTLNALIPTLLEAEDATFLDIGRFLESERRRDEILEQVSDERQEYWRENPPSKSDVGPVARRVSNFYEGPLATICGGKRGEGLNVEEIIQNNQILLVDTWPKSVDGFMLGALVMAKIQQAIFKRDLALQYPVVNVYADEFHNFVNSRLSEVLLEARSFGISLCMANPSPLKLSEIWSDMRVAVSSYVIFQLAAEDASVFKGRFQETAQPLDHFDRMKLDMYKALHEHATDYQSRFRYEDEMDAIKGKQKPHTLLDEIPDLQPGEAVFINARTHESAKIRIPFPPEPPNTDYIQDIIENTYAESSRIRTVHKSPRHSPQVRHTETNDKDFSVPEGKVKKRNPKRPR
jgi:hypothetical protein